jgi:hypothetical protein
MLLNYIENSTEIENREKSRHFKFLLIASMYRFVAAGLRSAWIGVSGTISVFRSPINPGIGVLGSNFSRNDKKIARSHVFTMKQLQIRMTYYDLFFIKKLPNFIHNLPRIWTPRHDQRCRS